MSPMSATASYKLLVCDPDEGFADQVRSLQVGGRHNVMAAGRLEGALELAFHWRPDVVMLSSDLADVMGTGAVEKLRLLVPRPAILLTGTMDRFDAIWRVWRRGCDEVLFRPIISSAELQSMVAAAVESARRERHTPLPGFYPKAIA